MREKIRDTLNLLRISTALKRSRREPAVAHAHFRVQSSAGVSLFCTVMGDNPSKVIIVGHPFAVGSRYEEVVRLAETLSRSFSVITFDFRGHGRSTGTYIPGFRGVSDDFERVVSSASEMGFDAIGVAGFSLGAAAALITAAESRSVDAIASIGCPPTFPDIERFRSRPLLWRILMRALRVRVSAGIEPEPTPLSVADQLPAVPKIFFFGEWEVFPRESMNELFRRSSEPKELRIVSGVWHASLGGQENFLGEWFEEHL